MDKPEKLCDFSCEHAEFAKNTYYSDNITMYCKKTKTMVRKFSPCIVRQNKKTKKERK